MTELIRQAKEKDPAFGAELEREYRTLSGRPAFGLNFERHSPDAVELYGRLVCCGDKVRVLSPRGSPDPGDRRLWRVTRIETTGGQRRGHIDAIGDDGRAPTTVAADDLVVVAEFRDPIHPGLVSTGSVQRGTDKPAHTVINGENLHVLKALTQSYRGTVDAIYIDPPYNTGARDWKYDNDYVEGDDLYRHSKWLAFMERRLLLARQLLNPRNSVLVVTIDEKEYLRLGLLLEQTFPEAAIHAVTAVVSPQRSASPGAFSRVEEYIFFARFGEAVVTPTSDDMLLAGEERAHPRVWFSMIRSGTGARRSDNPKLFYPIFVDEATHQIVTVGTPLPVGQSREEVEGPSGFTAVWPIRRDGSEGRWQLRHETLSELHRSGMAKVGARNRRGNLAIMYVRTGDRERIERGEIARTGVDEFGDAIFERSSSAHRRTPKSVWNRLAHDAGKHGSMLLGRLLPGRQFPFPKALYAVEDTLRFFVGDKPNAVVLDFFAGSGTTAHAVMRLNKQDGGRRTCISVTNNEVSADEQTRLVELGLRPGDPEWEALGICEHITKPRIQAAITGRTPNDEPIEGDYKFTDDFPMADGFAENAEFFTLTYENPAASGHNRSFERVAPLLWLRAGAEGRVIDAVPECGWEVADTYGILFDLDQACDFAHMVENTGRLHLAYVVTDDDLRFQSVAHQLRGGVEVVQLYESYLSNFRFAGSDP